MYSMTILMKVSEQNITSAEFEVCRLIDIDKFHTKSSCLSQRLSLPSLLLTGKEVSILPDTSTPIQFIILVEDCESHAIVAGEILLSYRGYTKVSISLSWNRRIVHL